MGFGYWSARAVCSVFGVESSGQINGAGYGTFGPQGQAEQWGGVDPSRQECLERRWGGAFNRPCFPTPRQRTTSPTAAWCLWWQRLLEVRCTPLDFSFVLIQVLIDLLQTRQAHLLRTHPQFIVRRVPPSGEPGAIGPCACGSVDRGQHLLAACYTAAKIDREEREGEKPSDHAPVVTLFT